MTRALRLALATVVAMAALSTSALARPRVVFACTCAPAGSVQIGDFAAQLDYAVFVGKITRVDPDRDTQGHETGILAVEQLFKGDLPSLVTIVGGSNSECLIRLEAGREMVTAARFEAAKVEPITCAPMADPMSPDGKRLIEEATKAYGPPRTFPPPLPGAEPAPAVLGGGIEPLLIIAMALVLGIVVASAVLGRRSRSAR